MIEFFKQLFSKVNFKSENEEMNKLNKIIYSIIILCGIIFIGLILYFIIHNFPNFVEELQYNWKDAKTILNG